MQTRRKIVRRSEVEPGQVFYHMGSQFRAIHLNEVAVRRPGLGSCLLSTTDDALGYRVVATAGDPNTLVEVDVPDRRGATHGRRRGSGDRRRVRGHDRRQYQRRARSLCGLR